MTHFLVSDKKPDGFKLEEILTAIRADMLFRCTKITSDQRPEARQVLDNNVQILGLISEAIGLAEDSTKILDQSFGRNDGNSSPRIGKP